MNVKYRGFFMCVLVSSGGASAGDRDMTQAKQWLDLQSSGAVASQVSVQAANEIEREKAVDRFIKTYSLAIPKSFYGSGFQVGN